MLEDKGFESIVTLLFGSRKAGGETISVILLLVDETRETSVLTLVVLNLDLEILGLFGELLSESLEFEELKRLVNDSHLIDSETYLLFPALKFLDKEVVSLCYLAKLRVHTTLKVNEILPSLKRIPGVLISLSHNLIQMPHRDLGHQRLLHGSAKDGFHAGISSLS